MATVFIIGRLFFGAFFLYNGFMHLYKLSSYAGYAGMKGVPMPKAAVAVSGIMLLLAGASVMAGYYMIYGLLLCALFLLPTTIMMHAFWLTPDPAARNAERIQFNKNVALLGALLMFIALTWPW